MCVRISAIQTSEWIIILQGYIDIEGKFEDIMTSKANYLNNLKKMHGEETEIEEIDSLVSKNQMKLTIVILDGR